MRIISITIDEDLLVQLETFAAKHRVSRSKAVREAIRLMLKERGVTK